MEARGKKGAVLQGLIMLEIEADVGVQGIEEAKVIVAEVDEFTRDSEAVVVNGMEISSLARCIDFSSFISIEESASALNCFVLGFDDGE